MLLEPPWHPGIRSIALPACSWHPTRHGCAWPPPSTTASGERTRMRMERRSRQHCAVLGFSQVLKDLYSCWNNYVSWYWHQNVVLLVCIYIKRFFALNHIFKKWLYYVLCLQLYEATMLNISNMIDLNSLHCRMLLIIKQLFRNCHITPETSTIIPIWLSKTLILHSLCIDSSKV